MHQNTFANEDLSRTLLRELALLPKPPSLIWGREMWSKERGRKRKMKERERKDNSQSKKNSGCRLKARGTTFIFCLSLRGSAIALCGSMAQSLAHLE